MAGNSFETHDQSHVGGVVVMALDKNGQAIPVDVTPPFTLEQLCRALGAHAVLCRGEGDMEKSAEQIRSFALKQASKEESPQ